MNFCMWFVCLVMLIFVDDVVLLMNYIVDVWIWIDVVQPPLCQRDCVCYVLRVIVIRLSYIAATGRRPKQ